ncbi:DoxX family protein [Corynebacterium antarcticum]|uniref:DoxX family protein n=1 Tax=Corynebacterium antarcticum TaxID=2800405 RepID=UPI002002CDAC|nr:DoxX family protein [Corynebacterium antarcticum]
MILLPSWWVPPALLAAVLLLDVALSIRPLGFIRMCLHGVRFPEEWWWILLVVKVLAAGGLIAGIWVPGIAFAANSGVIAYFLCASAAHIRAKATGAAFRVNCLGILALSCVTLVSSFL